MMDIKITPYGDLEFDTIPNTLDNIDRVLQDMYITLKTSIGRWKGAEAIGTKLQLYRGMVIDQEIATAIAAEIENILNKTPTLLGYSFKVELKYVMGSNVFMNILITFGGTTFPIEAVMNPYDSIFFKKSSEGIDDKDYNKVKSNWNILNRSRGD